MNSLRDRIIVVILEKDRMKVLEHTLNNYSDSNDLDIERIIDTQDNIKITIKLRNEEILNKYKSSFLDKHKNTVEVDISFIKLNYCLIYARDISHVFDGFIEVEIYPVVNNNFLADIEFKELASQIGRTINPKMIYEIKNFEHFELLWFENKSSFVRISNIESLNDEKEIIDGLKLMMKNVAAHNKRL